jgi:hypothetical protein
LNLLFSSKSKTLLFVRQRRILLRKTSLWLSCGLRPCAGSVSKKGQAKLALFWGKDNETPRAGILHSKMGVYFCRFPGLFKTRHGYAL